MFVLELCNPNLMLIHLHGFASGVSSSKVEFIREYLSQNPVCSLFTMDMDYHRTTTSKALELLDTLIKGFKGKGFEVILSGSSHGAYLILNYLRFYGENVMGSLLFAPSYSTLALTVEEVGEQACKPWLEGKEELHILECETGLDLYIHRDFAVDILNKGYEILRGTEVFFEEKPKVPIVIVHGRQDTVVPVEHSRIFVSKVRVKEYIEVDDDHRLSKNFKNVLMRTFEVLGL